MSAPPPPTKPRLELVISGEHGTESVPPPPSEREPTGRIVRAGEDEIARGSAEERASAEGGARASGKKTIDRERLQSDVHSRVATSVLSAKVFGPAEVRMIRSLARTVGLTGLFSVAIGSIVIAQITMGRVNVIAVVAGVLVGAIGLWSLLGGYHLNRIGAARTGQGTREDAAHLVAAFGNLRSIFLLKAIGLFLVLALSCFAFSVVASLLALL